jgi:predicted AlkP superfamily pyrophosphatase or phosphodiesterase
VNCIEDPNTRVVDSDEGSRDQRGASPRRLMSDTLGDALRMATQFESKVISISMKDRAAIFLGGRTANAAYWYDGRTGRFVSSTYYMDKLPAWVAEFNRQEPLKRYCGKPWQALPETPGAAGRVFSEYRPAAGEPCPSPRFLNWIEKTPYMNEVELSLARAALREEKLGQGPGTDLLVICPSANDFVGHEYGPYSSQVADMTLRTDRELAAFLDDLDKSLGLQNVWIALSSDHGVSPTPEYITGHNLGHGLFESKTVREAVQARLGTAFGEDNWIENLDTPYIFLNQETIARRQVSPEKAAEEAARAAVEVPGIFAAYTRSEVLRGGHPKNSIPHKVFNSFNLQRSGDVFFVLEPYAVASGRESSATHGTPWTYDAQVPLMFWGSAFRPGRYSEPCQPVDLAATVASALGIEPPAGSVGTPLSQALAHR